MGYIAWRSYRVSDDVSTLIAHIHDALGHQLVCDLLLSQNVCCNVVRGDPGHLLGHVASFREVHRYRGILDRRQGDSDADRIDIVEFLVSVILIDRNEALWVAKTGRFRDGCHAGQRWNDERKLRLEN